MDRDYRNFNSLEQSVDKDVQRPTKSTYLLTCNRCPQCKFFRGVFVIFWKNVQDDVRDKKCMYLSLQTVYSHAHADNLGLSMSCFNGKREPPAFTPYVAPKLSDASCSSMLSKL